MDSVDSKPPLLFAAASLCAGLFWIGVQAEHGEPAGWLGCIGDLVPATPIHGMMGDAGGYWQDADGSWFYDAGCDASDEEPDICIDPELLRGCAATHSC